MSRLVVAITGASGVALGIRLLETLSHRVESHLILTEWAKRTIEVETDRAVGDVASLASFLHENDDLSDCLASGSFATDGMVVVPCSIRTLSAVANSQSGTLVDRAADVHLKERRKLILCVRETPLHLGHLRLMERATECGAIILPPIPAFYGRPKTISELMDQTIARILDLLGIKHDIGNRWQGDPR